MVQKAKSKPIKTFISRDGSKIEIIEEHGEDPNFPVTGLVYPKTLTIYGGGHLINLTKDYKFLPNGESSYDCMEEVHET